MMNLKMILIITLLIQIVAILLINGFLLYKSYSSTETGAALFAKYSWMNYTGIGMNLGAIIVATLLFLRQ